MVTHIKHFTNDFILSLDLQSGHVQHFKEKTGLILETLKSGKLVWRKRARVGKKVKSITLGYFPSVSIEQARNKFFQEANSPNAIQTVEQLSDVFITRYLKRHRKDCYREERRFISDIKPVLGKLKIHTISTLDISNFLSDIVERGAPSTANEVLKLLKQMFVWANTQGYTGNNPVSIIRKRDVGGSEKRRQVFLNEDELLRVWNFLENGNSRIRIQNRLMFQWIILHGIRQSNARTLEFADIDLEKKLWTIPEEKLKYAPDDGQFLYVPLSDKAIEIVQRLKAMNPDGRWCFPSVTDNNNHIEDKTVNKICREAINNKVDTKYFTPHDLRRTFATLINKKEFADPVLTEKLLGHAMPQIMAIYNKNLMLPQRKEALAKWASWLSENTHSQKQEQGIR